MDAVNPYASPASVEADRSVPLPPPPVGDWAASAASSLGSLALGLVFILCAEVALYTLRPLVPEVPVQGLFFAGWFATVAGGVWAVTGIVGLGVVPRNNAARGPLYAALALMSLAALFEGIALGLRVLSPQSSSAAWLYYIGFQIAILALVFTGTVLGGLARHLGQPRLVRWLRLVGVGAVLFIVADVLYMVYLWLSRSSSIVAHGIGKIVVVSAMWGIYGAYLRLTLGVRGVLRQEAAKSDDEARAVVAEPPPGAAWLAERPDSLRRVAQGMTFAIATVIVAGIAMWIETWRLISPELIAYRQILQILGLFILAGQVLKLFTAQRWMAVPEEARARELAQAAAATALLAGFVAAMRSLADWKIIRPLDLPVELPVELIGVGFEIVWTLLALNCLKRTCTFIGRSDLARHVRLLMIVAVALDAFYAVTYWMAVYGPLPSEFIIYIHFVVRAIVFYANIALIVWFAMQYARIRAALLCGDGGAPVQLSEVDGNGQTSVATPSPLAPG